MRRGLLPSARHHRKDATPSEAIAGHKPMLRCPLKSANLLSFQIVVIMITITLLNEVSRSSAAG
jgi:hypothetical protein